MADQPRSGAAQRRPRPAAPTAAGRAAAGRVRPAARRRRARRLRQPGAARAAARARSLHGRDAAFATELGYGTLRGRGTYDAVLAACVDRPLDDVDAPVLDVLRLGAHQLLGDAGARPTRPSARPSSWPARCWAKAAPSSSTRCCGGSSADDLDTWLARVAPPYDDDPIGNLALSPLAPALDRLRASATSLGGSLDATGGAAGGRQRRRRPSRWWPGPGRSTVDELVAAGAEPARWSPYAAVLPGGDPGDLAAVRDGRAGGAGRGQPARRARARRTRPSTGATSGGSTCAPVPAARRRCSVPSPATRGARLVANEVSAAPGRAGPAYGGVRRRRRRGRRPAAALAGRRPSTGCSSTRRAPGWARCAAGPRRAGVGGPRTSPVLRGLQQDLLASGLRSRAPRRRRRLRHLLPAPGRDPRRRRRRAAQRRCRADRRARRCCPACPTSATARTSSSGRTCTAPTRCTSPSSASTNTTTTTTNFKVDHAVTGNATASPQVSAPKIQVDHAVTDTRVCEAVTPDSVLRPPRRRRR